MERTAERMAAADTEKHQEPERLTIDEPIQIVDGDLTEGGEHDE